MEELKATINALIAGLEIMKTQKGFVVCSEQHVLIGEGSGINGTDYDVRGVQSINAIIFTSLDIANRYGIDSFLIDGNNKQIQLFVKSVDDFCNEEIARCYSLIEILNNNN